MVVTNHLLSEMILQVDRGDFNLGPRWYRRLANEQLVEESDMKLGFVVFLLLFLR